MPTTKLILRHAITSLLKLEHRHLVSRFLATHVPILGLGGRGPTSGKDVLARLGQLSDVSRSALLPFRVLFDLLEPEGEAALRARLGSAGAARLAAEPPRKMALTAALVAPALAWAAREDANVAPPRVADWWGTGRALLKLSYEDGFKHVASVMARREQRPAALLGVEHRGRVVTARVSVGVAGAVRPDEIAFDERTQRLTVYAPDRRLDSHVRAFEQVLTGGNATFEPLPEINLEPFVFHFDAALDAAGVAAIEGVRVIGAYMTERNHPYRTESVDVRYGDVRRAIQDGVSRGKHLTRVDLEVVLSSGQTTRVNLGRGLLTLDVNHREILVPFLTRGGVLKRRRVS